MDKKQNSLLWGAVCLSLLIHALMFLNITSPPATLGTSKDNNRITILISGSAASAPPTSEIAPLLKAHNENHETQQNAPEPVENSGHGPKPTTRPPPRPDKQPASLTKSDNTLPASDNNPADKPVNNQPLEALTEAVEPGTDELRATPAQDVTTPRPPAEQLTPAKPISPPTSGSLSSREITSLGKDRVQQGTLDELTALLQKAIEQKKNYPLIAKRKKRSGISRVSFRVHPQGTITNIRLIKSAGYRPLDNAALTAISKASPLDAVSTLITEPHDQEFDIVFTLK